MYESTSISSLLIYISRMQLIKSFFFLFFFQYYQYLKTMSNHHPEPTYRSFCLFHSEYSTTWIASDAHVVEFHKILRLCERACSLCSEVSSQSQQFPLFYKNGFCKICEIIVYFNWKYGMSMKNFRDTFNMQKSLSAFWLPLLHFSVTLNLH